MARQAVRNAPAVLKARAEYGPRARALGGTPPAAWLTGLSHRPNVFR
ncbi:hypothetical protein OG883_42595 [Streptomyces sp. NBC_01142]|nr:hypothetical protein [Streptomyces sp. NBC_01142]MCX4826333.1 hypothetical protein [Streptomyces sp. NBC_01142]